MLRKSLWVLSAFILVVQGKKWKLLIILFIDIFRYIFTISYTEKFILSAHISFALHWFLATKVLCPLHFVRWQEGWHLFVDFISVWEINLWDVPCITYLHWNHCLSAHISELISVRFLYICSSLKFRFCFCRQT